MLLIFLKLVGKGSSLLFAEVRCDWNSLVAIVTKLVKTSKMARRPKYYTPKEVAAHNVASDCWVSYLGKVYNLTPLCQQYAGEELILPDYYFWPSGDKVCCR